MAPFHLLLMFENPNGFEMWKLTINAFKVMQTSDTVESKSLHTVT